MILVEIHYIGRTVILVAPIGRCVVRVWNLENVLRKFQRLFPVLIYGVRFPLVKREVVTSGSQRRGANAFLFLIVG